MLGFRQLLRFYLFCSVFFSLNTYVKFTIEYIYNPNILNKQDRCILFTYSDTFLTNLDDITTSDTIAIIILKCFAFKHVKVEK